MFVGKISANEPIRINNIQALYICCNENIGFHSQVCGVISFVVSSQLINVVIKLKKHKQFKSHEITLNIFQNKLSDNYNSSLIIVNAQIIDNFL